MMAPASVRRLSELQEAICHWAYPRGLSRPHDLPGELIISLTSYPPRFPTLDFTLRSLLRQTVSPDRIIVWIANDDIAQLPSEVRDLEGIEIRSVPDLRSYKKLVFCLDEYPNSFIVTCDDDNFYPPQWLEQLTARWTDEEPAIVCHRAHRIEWDANGSVKPYENWERDVQDAKARHPSTDLLPTGLGGILYFPRSLHKDVTRSELFLTHCPSADDLWFFWQARRKGSKYRKVGGKFPELYWPGSQDFALYNSNVTNNEVQMNALLDAYGLPSHAVKVGPANEDIAPV